MKYVFYAILLYLLYQFIFKLVIPVYITTKKVKKGFREMSARMNRSDGQNKMQEHMQQQQNNAPQQEQPASPKHKAGDYIEFEEVK
jgi:predicted Holliday junction resolvase-like endonuclease